MQSRKIGLAFRATPSCCALIVALAGGRSAPAQQPAPIPVATRARAAIRPDPDQQPAQQASLFGAVAAVRGNVLQMSAPDGRGLTRVIFAADTQIIRDETFTIDVLKPGMKVTGSGRQVEGTGIGSVPLQVEVQTLQMAGGMGNPFAFFGGDTSPLLRGGRASVLRKMNYAGTIEFDAQVKSVSPLVLVDEQGQPLPVVIGKEIKVTQRGPHPIKEGDITAGAFVMAMGQRAPDGLVKARMIVLLGEGGTGNSVSGTIMGVNAGGLTVRARFAPTDQKIQVAPQAKIYVQESLDLDSIQVGDSMAFTGKVLAGTGSAPTALVVRTITRADEETPQIADTPRGPFGGNAVTATVKGRITGFDPLRVQTADGREVLVRVPGQLVYVRYRPQARTALKVGQHVLLVGHSTENGLSADVIVLNPSLGPGPNF
jgi:hypothetical protein